MKKITQLRIDMICDILLLLLIVLGVDVRTRFAHKYMYTNTASFFFSRAEHLFQTGKYFTYDTYSFAPLVHFENYPPGLSYISVGLYHLTKWIHHYSFYEFVVVFPVVMFVFLLVFGYQMISRLYGRPAGLFYGVLCTIMPIAHKLTSTYYFTSESVGVLFTLCALYAMMHVERRPVWYTLWAIGSMVCLELTYQLFAHIVLISLCLAIINRQSRVLFRSYIVITFLPLLIAHGICLGIIGIDYSPIFVLREIALGIMIRNTDAYSVIMSSRVKLQPMGFSKFRYDFMWMNIPGMIAGAYICLRRIKSVRYMIPFVGTIIGMVFMGKYIKFRFMAFPFIVIITSIGFQWLLTLDKRILAYKMRKHEHKSRKRAVDENI